MRFVASLSHFLHQRLLWLLLASYGIAAFLPWFGLWIRDIGLWQMHLFREDTSISPPMLILAFLLFNAGMGIPQLRSREWARNAVELLSGVAGNLFIPLLFILVVSQIMRLWHNPEEVQNILVGLALVASMPIAGSSTAWSQNADGDMSISLGLVLLSTFASPLTTPLVLQAVGFMTTGVYSRDLNELARYGTGAFLMFFVLLPSIAGMAVRALAGARATAKIRPVLKLVNIFALLVLSYSNAAVSLPQAIARPDPDFLLITALIVGSLCILAFASGWWIARALRTDPPQEAALMFGLGMNNNGTGLVLASVTLANHPLVMLPIIFYNLIQHLVAGAVDYARYRMVA